MIGNPASVAMGSRNVPFASSIPREKVRQLLRELRVLEVATGHCSIGSEGDSIGGGEGGGGGGSTSISNVETTMIR